MDTLAAGLAITIVGMGGTLVSLWFITLIITLLKRVLPYRESQEETKES